MVDKEGTRLLRMGLTILTKDTFLEHEEEWAERDHLYEALRGSRLVDKKPAGNWQSKQKHGGITWMVYLSNLSLSMNMIGHGGSCRVEQRISNIRRSNT